MSRKSTVVLLLLAGLLVLNCNLFTNTSIPPEPSPTLAPLTDTVVPSATLEPTAIPVKPSPTPVPEKPTPTETATEPIVYQAPFAGWSEEYQVIQVPPTLQEMINAGKASVVPLPTDKSIFKDQVYGVVQDEGFLGPFDFERLASFKDQASFAAIPARNIPEVPDFRNHGVLMGLVYDQNAFYGDKRSAVYEVYFFDKKAEVRSRGTGGVVKELEAGKDYFWTESKSNPEALTFFIKNGCWLCWNAGGRTGCLICFRS